MGSPIRTLALLLCFCHTGSHAVTITGYTATNNDRFASGFPTTPVENMNSAFVGEGYDWSGVAWSTNLAGSFYKNLGMLSPVHFLTAQHFEYPTDTTLGVRILGSDALVYSQNTTTITNLGYGVVLTNKSITNYDLAIGTVAAPLSNPSSMARYGVLDLNVSSTTNTFSNYENLDIFLYGRSSTTNGSPRVGETTLTAIVQNGPDPKQQLIQTTRTQVQLQTGDSAGPVLYGWTNPNGGSELTVLGTNSAIDTVNGFNYSSFLAYAEAMNAANAVMVQSGYALRVVGNPFATWQGGDGTMPQRDDVFRAGNWSGSVTPTDQYTLFDGSVSSFRSLDVNANSSLRGLYFKATAANDGFTFGGTGTLTIGRGGVTNYDNSRQVFTANITLGDHQYWDVGSGGITAGNINTAGRLLEIAGSGEALLSGVVSGSGGIALTGSLLHMTGINTYTGKTWVHTGELRVDGSIASSNQVIVESGASLSGIGVVSTITGAGSIDPGNSPGILTATAVDPSGGLDFSFEFTALGAPDYGSAGNSLNDVLHLTGATPFSQALSLSNTINIFLNVATLELHDVFRGGFYINQNIDFLSNIQNAAFAYYLQDAGGPIEYNEVNYSLYTGPWQLLLSTVNETANYNSGTENGRVMQISVIPEPSASMLILTGLTWLFLRRRLGA